ncbi:MAG: hypothetical protein L0Z55_09310 [Planctomycetes bacterium]|nr:hypothetical protein [Planctomycetota bacterium]
MRKYRDTFPQTNRRGGWRIVVAACFVAVAAFGSIASGSPSIWSPSSLPAVLSALAVRGGETGLNLFFTILSFALSVLPFTALFLAWVMPGYRTQLRIPIRSLILFGLGAAMCVLHLRLGWNYGERYQGEEFLEACVVYNSAATAILLVLLVCNLRFPSVGSCLAFQAALFAWFGYCAFPWLGETL